MGFLLEIFEIEGTRSAWEERCAWVVEYGCWFRCVPGGNNFWDVVWGCSVNFILCHCGNCCDSENGKERDQLKIPFLRMHRAWRLIEWERCGYGWRRRVKVDVELLRSRRHGRMNGDQKRWFSQMVQSLPAMLEILEFSPWVGKIPWRRKWQPTPVFLPGEFHGLRSLARLQSMESQRDTDWVTNTWNFHFH